MGWGRLWECPCPPPRVSARPRPAYPCRIASRSAFSRVSTAVHPLTALAPKRLAKAVTLPAGLHGWSQTRPDADHHWPLRVHAQSKACARAACYARCRHHCRQLAHCCVRRFAKEFYVCFAPHGRQASRAHRLPAQGRQRARCQQRRHFSAWPGRLGPRLVLCRPDV